MPKLRQTDQQRRELALAGAVARGAVYSGLKRDKDVAAALDISAPAYCRYKANSFRNADFSLFCRLARRLELTGEEVCKIVGVPYERKEP